MVLQCSLRSNSVKGRTSRGPSVDPIGAANRVGPKLLHQLEVSPIMAFLAWILDLEDS